MKGRTGDYAILELDGAGVAQGGEVDFGGGGVRHGAIASLTGSDLAFYTNGANSGLSVTERMRIDSNGTVAIGDTSTDNTSNRLKVKASGADGRIAMSTASTTGSAAIEAQVANYWSGSTFVGTGIVQHDSASSGTTAGISNANLGALRFQNTSAALIYTNGSTPIHFGTATTKRMTLDASGNFLVGTSSNANSAKINVQGVSGSRPIDVRSGLSSGSALTMLAFYDNASDFCGQITINADANTTQYVTSSDYRLKNNIVDAPSASDDIDAIQVRSFDWKADGSHQKYGMVAQELNTVAPEAVSTPEDPEEMMGVDYSKLVPMLVKEIQSLRARVAQLETN